MTTPLAADERWLAQVTARVEAELRRRVDAVRDGGGVPSDLGSPGELAARMLAAVPEPSPWNALGPFYGARSLAQLLGGVSRQAIEDRRRRHRLIALRTDDGAWVYPVFQFDDRNRVIGGVAEAHRALVTAGLDEWSAASALLGPQPSLGGRSIVAHLAAGGSRAAVDALCEETATALAS